MLNQKSELQRALEKQREAASRREAERNREENYKDDPRTALQRAIEQRAKHIEMTVGIFYLSFLFLCKTIFFLFLIKFLRLSNMSCFSAGTIPTNRATEQPFNNSESKTETARRFTMKLCKNEERKKD